MLDVSEAVKPQLAAQYETTGFVRAVELVENFVFLALGEQGFQILELEIR